jgi:GWxTD domain-containing protein
MKKLFLFLFLLNISVFAQEKIGFEFDYARFQFDSVKTYLEIYYSLNQTNLTKYRNDNKYYVGAYLDIQIVDSLAGDTLVNKRYITQTELKSEHDSSYIGKNLLGNVGFILNNGIYKLTISATDFANKQNRLEYSETIQIKGFPTDRFAISDIQLASKIISDSKNTESIFYKNTLEVIPNPINVYAENMPVLFYYAELYNLNIPQLKEKSLFLTKQLSDAYGNVLYIKKKPLVKNNNSIVEAGVINMKKYPTGEYLLSLSIIEDSLNIGVSSLKRLYLINPSVKKTPMADTKNLDVKSSEFGILSEEECDNLFEVSLPLALKGDEDAYNKLTTVEAKRKFLYDFWKKRDQIPETPQNEFKEEYLERVKFVEQRYRTFTRRGVKTDRGRVYLEYGEPDEVDSYPSEYNMKPYEIWHYFSIEGGVEFIFGDLTGYNNYELLHSTKRGELRDNNWRRRITVE